ncbi:hypothetical protein OQA88_3488 [Cercophora sp. LCS_1]
MTTNTLNLPPRFETRKLEPKHTPWAQALLSHSTMFCSPIWPVLCPTDKTVRTYRCFTALQHLCARNIASGYSYGVFDKEYVLKRPESVFEGGKLYWDETNLDATGDELLKQMDFPLVSVAMAYDGGEKRGESDWAGVIETILRLGTLLMTIDKLDERDKKIWKPEGLGEVMYRGGTSTRRDYEGFKLARSMADWLMREAAGLGFRGMQVGVAHPAIERIFLNPPAPFRGEVVSRIDALMFEELMDGEVVKPFEACGDVPMVRIWVSLE